MRIVAVILMAVLSCASALAQQSVPPPPEPAKDAPANAAVLKLLREGIPESDVMIQIRSSIDQFDTSVDAIIALKQAGVTERELKFILSREASTGRRQPPVESSADSGPSLAETMRFIQDKLNTFGTVSFVVFIQNTSNGSTGTGTHLHEISNVNADQNQCRISYRHKLTVDKGKNIYDLNRVIVLRDVQEIKVKPEEQLETEWNAQEGSPDNIITSTSPPITVLTLRNLHAKQDEEDFFRSTDANLADRVAKAMIHAVELCGGSNTPEPF